MKTFKGVKTFIEENSIARVRVKEDRLKLKFKYIEDMNIAQEEGDIILGNKISFEVLGQVFSETFCIQETHKDSLAEHRRDKAEVWVFGKELERLGRAIAEQAAYGIPGESTVQGGRIIKRF